ncbi:MAG: hypothetical protein K8E24_006165 [Methanobacterium paludis]|nr:hypothetical protein [Methanobacterium paludis]
MLEQYYLLPIILLLTILYLLSYFLYTDGNLKSSTYKNVWDVSLIVSSLIVGITGVVMIAFINLDMLPVDSTLLFWHVEAGIVTAVIGVFHIHIYWKSFKKIFK